LFDDQATSKDSVEEQKLLSLLDRRGSMTGKRESNKSLQAKPATDRRCLAKEGILDVERILTPPRVKGRALSNGAVGYSSQSDSRHYPPHGRAQARPLFWKRWPPCP